MKRLRLVMVGIVVAVVLPSTVMAQATKVKTNSLTRCQRFDAAVEIKATAVDQLRASRSATVTRINDRVTGLVGRMDVRGHDSSKLKADQAEFERRAALVDRDYNDLSTAIRSAKGSCAASGSLQLARDKLTILNSDLRDLQNWLAVILREDILSLKVAG